MRLGILSRNPSRYSTKRLVEAAKKRGHEVRVVDYLRCTNITTKKPKVIFVGEELTFDANSLTQEFVADPPQSPRTPPPRPGRLA